MAVSRMRLLDLVKAQCRIFSTTFNPKGLRTGNKVLRQRLRGPALAAYYPRRTVTLKDLEDLYPEFETWDDFEEDRLESIQIAKQRGKGAPKKKRTAEESKKFAGKKKKPAVAAAPARSTF
ncbi:MAG: mitochondral 37S ribosomal protein S27 [Pycnora praestabilis]|nr:MAG: mitochondral 37S ribosomal protein S27 [Pycnora praestabilis]